MNDAQMREAITSVYTSDTWKKRVKGMPENQVLAIYKSFIKNGKLPLKKRNPNDLILSESYVVQMDISENGKAVLMVTKFLTGQLEIMHIMFDDEAKDVYNKLMGNVFLKGE